MEILNIKKEMYDDKHHYHYYCASQFANTIACSEPKIKFKNFELEKQFKKDSLNNNLLTLNYELVRLSSIYGNAFLGLNLQKNDDDEKVPVFTIGVPINYKKIGLKLIELELLIDIVKNKSQTFFIVEKWNINSKNNWVERYGYLSNSMQIFELSNLNYDKVEPKNFNIFKNKIPYQIFYANPFSQPDLANVPKRLFDDYDNQIATLATDAKVNRGFYVLNENNQPNSIENANNLLKVINDPNKAIFRNKTRGSLVDTRFIELIQGNINSSLIKETIKFLDSEIKKFGFVRQNTTNQGTKNQTINEVDVLNSDADDYLEMKANLMEINWKKFICNIYIKYLAISNKVKLKMEEIYDMVDVECCGSTKWLQNPENKYVQNQNAILMNPNDFNNDNKKNRSKKNE